MPALLELATVHAHLLCVQRLLFHAHGDVQTAGDSSGVGGSHGGLGFELKLFALTVLEALTAPLQRHSVINNNQLATHDEA